MVASSTAADNPAKVLESVDQHYRSVRTLKTDFIQREKLAALGQTRESKGLLYLEKPGRMRWEYHIPAGQIFIADKEILWMYYPDEKTLYKLSYDKENLSQTPMALLFRETNGLQDHFLAEKMTPGEDGQMILNLQPKRKTLEISDISLIIELNDGSLKSMVVKDYYGNVNEIILGDVIEGVEMDPELFKIKVPPETKILTGEEIY